MVHEHQAAYYDAINTSNVASDVAPFVLFMLGCIQQALVAVLEQNAPVNASVNAPVNLKTPQAILQLLAENPALTRQQLADRLGEACRLLAELSKSCRMLGSKAGAQQRWPLAGYERAGRVILSVTHQKDRSEERR